ncbi:hypothetical protein DM02DRAFT_635494 [Periconia macrospinosa]|uniref:Tc1-like transposase DDE domain-containing protein n=1 Tax=Periconia macrospinosa TaxID=97972 RepID=A0A2V1D2L0_9PLEO|nr:hypothetical protein DM02DRAFT_635494 [Periconia macrospinosa]
MKWTEISGVRRASNDSLESLTRATRRPPSKAGRPVTVRPLTELSANIRSALLENPSYKYVDAASDVLHAAGKTACQNTLVRVAREHRDDAHPYAITRGIRSKKPKLNDEAQLERCKYSGWIIEQSLLRVRGVIFVCYDETSKAMGGTNLRGGKQLYTRPVGVNSNDIAVPIKPPKFHLMICAATSTATRVSHKRPCVIWQDDDDAHAARAENLKKLNQTLRNYVARKQALASTFGTPEYRQLRDINDRITKENTRAKDRNRAEGRTGGGLRRGVRKLWTPEKLFSQEDFVYTRGKGMSGAWFALEILQKHVFPYYIAVRDSHPEADVYLVMDNVRLHGLALRLLVPEIERLGILRAPHPPNSPDLHPIEHCFGRLEGFLDDYLVRGSSKHEKEQAIKYIQYIWQEDEGMRRYMDRHLSMDYFARVADRCLSRFGNNNYTG